MLLPTAALSHACRLFDGAFASIDGDELSAAYTRSKPPPPTWSSSSAPGGKVVDSYYASLTYGEPSHLALSLYAPAASRAALLNRHPPHAPLCLPATHLTRRPPQRTFRPQSLRPHLAATIAGEAEFVPLYHMLSQIGVAEGSTVVDLGSGTGRMVLGVALAFPTVRLVRLEPTASCPLTAHLLPSLLKPNTQMYLPGARH